jgi:murein L,D-transpeptidase YcbB/YkuD
MVFIILGLSLVSFSGCATFRKKDLEQQALRNQIQALEIQLSQKDQEIASLKDALEQGSREQMELTKIKNMPEVQETKWRPNVKQIQSALKNAGYNPGSIDGRIGGMTRDAIRAFQRANGLKVDGHIGRKTWSLLKKYLYKKEK